MRTSARAIRRITDATVRRAFNSAIESLETRRLLSGAGSPDQTYGAGGDVRVLTPGLSGPVLQALAAPDGSIYYLSDVPGVDDPTAARQLEHIPSALAITKVTSNGTIDTNFGENGRFTFTIGDGIVESTSSEAKMILLPTGKILLGGSVFKDNFASSDLFLTRIGTDGKLDFSYANTNGYLTLDASTSFGGSSTIPMDSFKDMALAPNGKLVILSQDGLQTQQFLLKVDLETAAPDASLGTAGAVHIDGQIPSLSALRGKLMVDSSSRIYFSTQGSGIYSLFRFTAAGSLDNTFNTSGSLDSSNARGPIASYEFGGFIYVAHPDASSGSNADTLSIFKVDPSNGVPDFSFGLSGFLNPTINDAEDVQIYASASSNGTVLVTAISRTDLTAFSYGLTATGSDSTVNFGSPLLDSIPTFDKVKIAARVNNSLVVVGSQAFPYSAQTQVIAFDTSGNTDSSFASVGTLFVTPSTGGAAEFQSIVPRADGGYIALLAESDFSLGSSNGANLSLVNISPSGVIESSNNLTARDTSLNTFTPSFAKLLPLGDGSFVAVLAGSSLTEICLIKILASGSVDSSFGQLSGVQTVTLNSAVGTPMTDYADVIFDPSVSKFTAAIRTSGISNPGLVVRFGLDGSVDSSFGTSGYLQFGDILPGALAIYAGGGFLLSSSLASSAGLDLRAINSNGSFNAAFNSGSPLNLSFGQNGASIVLPRTSLLLANGKFAIGGALSRLDGSVSPGREYESFFTLLINANGTPETTFGSNGLVTALSESLVSSEIFDIGEDPNGGLIAVGTINGAGLLIRFNVDGTIDPNYSAAGNTGSTSSFDRYLTLSVDSLGRAVAAGADAPLGGAQRQAVLTRFTASDALTPPSASLIVPSAPSSDAPSFPFSVTYTPASGRTIDTVSLDSSDIQVVLPDSSSGLVTFLSFTTNAGVITANYSVAPPVGGFQSGNYTFNLNPNAVFDSSGQSASGQSLGSTPLSIPSVTFVPPANPITGDTFLTFTVTYFPGASRLIDTSSLDSSDIRVFLPDSTDVPASLVSFTTGANSEVIAIYAFDAPVGGFPSGSYGFVLLPNAVLDSASVAIPGRTLGSANLTAPTGSLLLITNIQVTPATITPGTGLSFSLVISNSSAVSSLGTTASIDIQPADGSATFSIGTIVIPSVASNSSLTITAPPGLMLPGQTVLTPGTYKIRATLASPYVSTFASGAVLTVIAPPPPVVGGLDPSFGGGSGEVVQFVPNITITTTATINLPGSLLLSAGFTSDGNVAIFRTLANGQLDPAFGSAGQITFDIRSTFDVATAIVVDGSGNIIVTGYSVDPTGSGTTAFISRLSSTGQLDTTFTSSGTSLLTALFPGQITTPRSLFLDNSGHIYLIGTTTTGTDANNDAILVRANTSDGSLDGGFGTAGVVTANKPTAASFNTALLLANGSILIGGSVANADGTTRPLLLKYSSAGIEDAKFTKKAVFITPAGSSDRITVLTPMTTGLKPKDAIYVGGTRANAAGTASSAIVFRVTSAGAIDKSFGKGVITLSSGGSTLATVNSIIIQAEGRVLISITTASSSGSFQAGRFGVTVVRRDAKGNVDPFFNAGQPFILAAVPAETTAAQPVIGAFDDFATTRQGQANMVSGGAVRSVATRPSNGGTEVRVSGITPDGVDFTSALTIAKLPTTIVPGFKGTASLLVSNRGSLASKGNFSITLVATPTGGGAAITLKVLPQSKALKAGTSAKISVPIQLAKTFTPGSYTISAQLTPSFAELSTNNNSSALPNPFVVTSAPVKNAALTTLFSSTAATETLLFPVANDEELLAL